MLLAAPPVTLLTSPLALDYALGKDCIMHGYMLKLGNPFLTQWQRRYFYLFPNRLEWRGEGESRVSEGLGELWWKAGGGGTALECPGALLGKEFSLSKSPVDLSHF